MDEIGRALPRTACSSQTFMRTLERASCSNKKAAALVADRGSLHRLRPATADSGAQ
jgi:hypothetical protein